jgi:hypothetical protein
MVLCRLSFSPTRDAASFGALRPSPGFAAVESMRSILVSYTPHGQKWFPLASMF